MDWLCNNKRLQLINSRHNKYLLFTHLFRWLIRQWLFFASVTILRIFTTRVCHHIIVTNAFNPIIQQFLRCMQRIASQQELICVLLSLLDVFVHQCCSHPHLYSRQLLSSISCIINLSCWAAAARCNRVKALLLKRALPEINSTSHYASVGGGDDHNRRRRRPEPASLCLCLIVRETRIH